MNNLQLALAFQRLTFSYPQVAMTMFQAFGTAAEIYANRKDVCGVLPETTETLYKILNKDWSAELSWAEKEMEWCEKKSIRILSADSVDYPQRLLNSCDAPIALFYRGTADLNSEHIISIVGTRQSTEYGHDVVQRMMSDLKRRFDDVLVVSGLAYGIDVLSHREAMAVGYDTIGVLAHGLDTIYPANHRKTAIEMLGHGGLLTEYPSQTRGDRQNFLRRNRIVAGISDATIVVESKIRGGSLVTARLANDYGKEVFAVPGRITDECSEGCNNLIAQNKATVYVSADDIICSLNWHSEKEYSQAVRDGIQTTMFPELSADEQQIANVLANGDSQLNDLCVRLSMPVGIVSALLFQLEMKGIVRPLAGGVYHLIK